MRKVVADFFNVWSSMFELQNLSITFISLCPIFYWLCSVWSCSNHRYVFYYFLNFYKTVSDGPQCGFLYTCCLGATACSPVSFITNFKKILKVFFFPCATSYFFNQDPYICLRCWKNVHKCWRMAKHSLFRITHAVNSELIEEICSMQMCICVFL